MFSTLTKGQVLKYVFLPQVAPRIKAFMTAGFGSLAYFMALVYQAVKLLPDNHPYLDKNKPRDYSVRQVIAAAANNLTFSYKHIDQIIIFFALMAGVVLLAMQFLMLLATIMINPAAAQANMPENYGEFFITSNREEDLALRLLDSVFGVTGGTGTQGFFGSNETVGTTFHIALHQLFQFYSVGLLVIAAMIIIYFIFAVLAETAQTGTPFGKRYNHAWVPIRLVVGIGLLIPIGSGLNSGQWITLYAAKLGSGFATTGWVKFNETMRESYIPAKELVAQPNFPELKDITAFMMMAHACKEGYIRLNPDLGNKIDAYIVKDDNSVAPLNLIASGNGSGINTVSTHPTGGTNTVINNKEAGYLEAIEYSDSKMIRIRIGEKNSAHTTKMQGVYPYCGDITLSIPEKPFDQGRRGVKLTSASGLINEQYYKLIRDMWAKKSSYKKMAETAKDMMLSRLDHDAKTDPKPEFKREMQEVAESFIKEKLDAAINLLAAEFKKDEEYKRFGWGGAGIWYKKIADVNGRLVNAAMNKPQVTAYPHVMEYACDENKQNNQNVSPENCYNQEQAEGEEMVFASVKDKALSSALSDVFNYWYRDPEGGTGNVFIDTINVIMGTNGLFSMCANADIHPLAQLSAVGKGLVEAAIRNLGFALGGGAAGILTPYIGPALQAASGFFVTVASIGILIGFILYYIIPFMPFLYFMFAIGGWIKGLFEAMVGVPLWALAHIRIDGQGLPGDGAINGYFLIFEIFIRPILVVFGLLASILVFAAMVKVLNDVFYLAVSNLSGFDTTNSSQCGKGNGAATTAPPGSIDYMRGPVDEFFFTIVYAILVYMIGMSSFKLIDMIPNQILRWMGTGVNTFNDQAGEPAEGLVSKLAIGGGVMGSQLQGAGQAAGQAIGGGAGLVQKFMGSARN